MRLGIGNLHLLALAMGTVRYESDIYAEFGVNNAVIAGGSTREEHEENMLKLDVRARDGDDSITLNVEEEPLEGELLPAEGEEEQSDTDESGEESSEVADGEDSFEPSEPSEEIKTVAAEIDQHEVGFNQMRESAIANGLPADVADAIMSEYGSEEGISEGSYEALAKAGFNRQFVESYIKGQEALSEKFVGGVIQLAGGTARFNQLVAHMETNSPASLNSLYKAMESRDLDTITSIIDLTKGSITKKFGKAPARSVIKGAPALRQEPVKESKAEPFADRQEMIAAMKDPRYSKDDSYRKSVEARVHVSF